ncbi:MAG: hypothetical protein EHM23_12595, partial [Acidobacteria bacterium]
MRQECSGFALVIALIIALMLSLLCLSLTLSSMKEFQISNEFESHERALQIAEAGFNLARQDLRGNQLDQLLMQPGTVRVFKPDQTAPNWARRNPISPIDARNIDFEHMTSTGGSAISVTGLLTPTLGTVLEGGRYFARITDNPEADNDPTRDEDGTIYLRVIGIAQGLPGEVTSSGSNRKNAVAIIEGVLHRDTSFDMTAPMSFLGPRINAEFGGQPFLIDGYDHVDMSAGDLDKMGKGADKHTDPLEFPAVSCLDPNGAGGSVNDIKLSLNQNQYDSLVGAGGSPSVVDDTNEVQNSPNPDARNVLDPSYLASIARKLAAIADLRYEGDQSLGGNGQDALALGSPEDPKITYVHGNLDVSGSIVGAGLLLVTGDLKGNGSLIYEGLILVLGTGNVDFGGSNNGVLGGLVAANLVGSPPTFGPTSLKMHGNSDFYFRGDSIRMAVSL